MRSAPSQADIDKLEKAAWDANADAVLVWYRDRIAALERAAGDAWEDLHHWAALARRQRSEVPDADHVPWCPTDRGIAETERIRLRIQRALTPGQTPRSTR